jgi:hypothetical protein
MGCHGTFLFYFIFIAFLAVSLSLHEEPKNTTTTFSKTRPEDLKKSQSQKKYHGTCLAFFVFVLRPLACAYIAGL